MTPRDFILTHLDTAPRSLALRLEAALLLLDTVPNYHPPIARWQAELARHQARAALPPSVMSVVSVKSDPSVLPSFRPSVSPCPPHATFCTRFGLPCDEAFCAACTAAREDRTVDPATGLTRASLYINDLRARGLAYGAIICAHRAETGRYTEQRCCGGKTKHIPIYLCLLTHRDADCAHCPRKTPASPLQPHDC